MKRASKVLREDGATWKRLHEALVNAFPSDLNRMVRFHLGQNLVRLTQPGNLNAVVHELMEWVVSQDVAEQLIMGARLHNHTNGELRNCARHISSKMHGSTAVLPAKIPGERTVDPSIRKLLVDILTDHDQKVSPRYTLLLLLPQELVDELINSAADHPDPWAAWADRVAETYASRSEDMEWLREFIDLILQVTYAPASRTNPYQKAGTLPANSRSYVRRDCDLNLARALQSRALIAVHGDFNIGKSSLLLQTTSDLKTLNGPQWTVCTIDAQGILTPNFRTATKTIFEDIGRCLGTEIVKWRDVGEATRTRPLIIQVDEFGALEGPALKFVINGFQHLVRTHDQWVRIIIAMPREIQDFLGDFKLKDERLKQNWTSIKVDKLSAEGVDTLLDHLQPAARDLTREHRAEIDKRVDGNPRPLQCLCFELFDAYARDPNSDLRSIIYDPKSYE